MIMKKTWVLALPLLLAACSSKLDLVELTDWQFEYNGQQYPATVPGFIHNDLMSNGLIPDPYYGTNEDSMQWVGDSLWIYRTYLHYDKLPDGDTLWLVFEGLAGNATLWIGNPYPEDTINGAIIMPQHIGSMDNMFCQYKIPLPGVKKLEKQFIFKDSIPIMIMFEPLNDSVREMKYGIPLPERRAFTRIAPYQQGWDWGPRLATCGIWKRVYITNKSQSELKEPSDDNSFCSFSSDWNKIELRQERDSIGQSFTFYKDGKPIFIKGANWIPVHSFPVLDSANRARYRYLLCSAKEAGFNMIRIWGGGIYEHDYFYDLCDSLGLMVWQDFVFAGTPYPDNEEMLSSIDREARQQVARLSKHPCIVLWCGNNEVKNGWEDWGWQGQFNWTPEQRARLEKAMDTIFGYSRDFETSGQQDFKTRGYTNTSSTSILAKAVRDCDPRQRPYITTSPLYGWGHPECTTHGDSHYWGVWWGELPFEMYREKTGRFMSEYGFQSYPMMSTIRQFCPEDQLSIESPTLRNHQKHSRGREIIDKAMRQYYGFDSRTLGLEDYAYVSQLLQAWGVGYGILCHLEAGMAGGTPAHPAGKAGGTPAHPAGKAGETPAHPAGKAGETPAHPGRCSGTLYWQLNDCWPVASWSSIDYYGNWKALHYRAQALFRVESGKWKEESERWRQYYSVYPKDRRYEEPEYQTSQAWQSDGALVVSLRAESDLYDVYLDTEPHVDGHFTRNFFDLKAGETVSAKFVPYDAKADVSRAKVRVRTLNELYRKAR